MLSCEQFLHANDLLKDGIAEDPTIEGAPPSPTVIQTTQKRTGELQLTLTKATRVTKLAVKLVGYADVKIGNKPFTSGKTLEREVVLWEQRLLEKVAFLLLVFDRLLTAAQGTHTFRFNLTIPTAQATFTLCGYGKVWHVLQATAVGLGVLGSDLVAERAIDIISSPASSGAPPPPLDLELQEFSALGPMSVRLRSDALTVACLVRTDIALSDPPPGLVIFAITLGVRQIYKLTPLKGNGPTYEKAHRTRIYKLDGKNLPTMSSTPVPPHPLRKGAYGDVTLPLAPAETYTPPPPPAFSMTRQRSQQEIPILARPPAGQMWRLKHLCRLPHDDIIQASTCEETQTPIRRSHEVRPSVLCGTLAQPVRSLFWRLNTPFVASPCCELRSSSPSLSLAAAACSRVSSCRRCAEPLFS